jgi:hypothetical protein
LTVKDFRLEVISLLQASQLIMESKMNKFVAAMLLAVAPTISLAGGHSAFSGHGTGVTTNTNVMEGVTGVHVHNTTNDVWIYDNPPEGFPAAVHAHCNWFIAMAAGQEQPMGGSVTCQAINPNGDIGLWNGTFQPNGTVEPILIAGTGQWADYIGAKWVGVTTSNPSKLSSVYNFTPAN